jgi:hypothetical protein
MDTTYSLADIAAATGGNRNNDGFGDGNGWWIILFLLICGCGGYGFGGWGGNGGGANSPAFQGYATRADIDAALSTQGIENGIQNLSGQLCNGLAGVNANLSNLGYQMQQCCCDTREAIAGVNYNMAAQTNILQNTVNNGFRDVIEAQNAGTQRIIDLFTQDKIQSLQTELQSAQLQLSNNAQTNSIINALRPTPVPSYPVMSPYTSIINPTGFSFGGGCGCNTGCGC